MCKLNLLCLIIPCIFFSACDKSRIYEENKTISDMVWDKDEKVSFEVAITDSLNPVNFYVNVRHADGYPYSNLYLFLTTSFPDGRMAKDTLECILADETGKWLGDGLGDIWDNRIPFKKGVRLPMQGTYTFTLEQAMRVEKLPLVMDVGIRIEKQNNQ